MKYLWSPMGLGAVCTSNNDGKFSTIQALWYHYQCHEKKYKNVNERKLTKIISRKILSTETDTRERVNWQMGIILSYIYTLDIYFMCVKMAYPC